jgi:hypothetical protein
VINRETRVKASIAQQVLERDLDFMAPQPRELTGRLYVPMMRLCIIQTELVLHVLKDQLKYGPESGKTNKDRHRKQSRVVANRIKALGAWVVVVVVLTVCGVDDRLRQVQRVASC